jgi:hypothetical protein
MTGGSGKEVSGEAWAGRAAIGGWRIESNPAPLSSTPTYTNASGTYSFVVSPNSGTYTISEVASPPGFVPTPGAIWVNTTPISGQVTVFASDVAGPNFGNVCLGAGNGFTLGYWSNKNGQAVLQSHDVAWRAELNALCLRRANGSDYDVPGGAFSTAYPDFRSWILGANATNMAYMLSAQLTAMKLNTLYKGAGGMVFAGTAPADAHQRGCKRTASSPSPT